MPSKSISKRLAQPKSWRDHPAMWVIGCIDSHGAIWANPSKEGRTHRIEESTGKRWRWCVWSQEFCDVFAGTGHLTAEEIFTIREWLIRRGYTSEKTFPNPLET